MSAEELTIWPLTRVSKDVSLTEAAGVMSNRSIGALGVFDEGGFIGILTERDIVWVVSQGKVPSSVTVGEIVNDFPVVLDAPVTRSQAAKRMRSAHVRHIVVRQKDDYGIISMRDLLTDVP